MEGGSGGSTLPVSFWIERRCLEPKPDEAGLAGRKEQRCPGELGVVVDRRLSLGDQSSVSGTGSPQKKRNAIVRKETTDTQEYQAYHIDGMDLNKEEMSFVPSAVSDSVGWHEPK